MRDISIRTLRCAAPLVALCVLAGLVPQRALAQDPTTSISGIVRVPSFLRGDRTEPDVVVQLVDPAGKVRATTTDGAGAFGFAGLAPGRYALLVEQPQYARFRLEVNLPAPRVEPITIRLQFKTSANTPDFVPIRDRWSIEFPEWQRYAPPLPGDYPYSGGARLNPYRPHKWKGDRPIVGQSVFLALTGIAELPFEYRTLPTASGISTEKPGSASFFGRSEQLAFLPSGIFSAELFHGDTSFRPKDWALKVTPIFNVNYNEVRERGVLDVSPEQASTRRRRQDFSLQDAYAEVKLFDVGANYDFVSLRAGIQPFTSDFRGFLFRDNNLGVRLFGTWGRNRNQWNVAYFDQLEKETNSGLNLFERRDQMVMIANYYRQDFLASGYTISPSFHANMDAGTAIRFDANGFLVRPAPIGLIRPHKVTAYYAGLGGDGHWGRLNITHQVYQAFGRDEANGISGQKTDINAQFAALEVSVDHNWVRPRASVVWSSGDTNPDDSTARGFDAIVDAPNVIGGGFSFWNRQGIRLLQTGVELVGRNSVIASLRSSKSEGQASFVNPGVFLYNAGLDAEFTPKLRTTINATFVRFQSTATLRRVLFQDSISRDAGIDYSVGAQYRPWLNDNVLLSAGVSVFSPLRGFKQILAGDLLYSPFVMLTLTY